MAIFTASLFEFIGEVFIYVLAFIALLVLIALLQLVVSMRVHKFVFPRFQSVLLDLLHPIIRALFDIFRLDAAERVEQHALGDDPCLFRCAHALDEVGKASRSKHCLRPAVLDNPSHKRAAGDNVEFVAKFLRISLEGVNGAPATFCALDAVLRGKLGWALDGTQALGEDDDAVLHRRFGKRLLVDNVLETDVQGVELVWVETRISWDRLYDKLYLGIARRQES